jgi:hypothetical protein
MDRDANGNITCIDGTCLLWAGLALNRLESKNPTFPEAHAENAAGKCRWAQKLRFAIVWTI